MPRLRPREIVLALAIAAAVGAVSRSPRPYLAPGSLIAHRRYEQLLDGRRAAVLDVVWTHDRYEGRPAVKDVTRVRSRTLRDMAGVRDRFEARTVSTLLRTPEGELLRLESVTRQASRTDRVEVRRTDTGYAVRRVIGGNEERAEIVTDGPAMVDAECFLGPKVRSGEARAGSRWTYPQLDLGRDRVVEAELEVVGPERAGAQGA